MKITVDFPEFLLNLMCDKQAILTGKKRNDMTPEEKEVNAFMAGYNAGVAAFTENIIEDYEFTKEMALLEARQKQK